jgi:hypothetical protein
MTTAEQIEALVILRDEAKRKLRFIQSKGGSRRSVALQPYWRDLVDTITVMEALRDESNAPPPRPAYVKLTKQWPLQKECNAYYGNPRSTNFQSIHLVTVPCPWKLSTKAIQSAGAC